MSLKIPAYTHPCLSPSFYVDQPKIIFLLGVPDGTPTLVSHIIDLTDIDAPMVTYIASNSKTDPLYEWNSMAEKSCFTNPSTYTSTGAPAAYASTEVQQFGPTSSGALLLTTNELNQAYDMPIVQFRSSKLFASTQVRDRDGFTVAWANFTNIDPVSDIKTLKEGWVGVKRNLTNIIIAPQGFDSLPLTAPMLAVGAYSTTNTSGVLALFDKDGVGSLYMASSVVRDPATNAPLSWLFAGPKRPIDNGGAILTPNAVAISAHGVAYILDQAANNLTVVYFLRPNTTNRLVKVATNGGGGLPLFNKNMVGMVLQEPSGSTGKIVIYSLDKSTGVAKFNFLDTATGIWTGPGLVNPPPPQQQPPSRNTTASHHDGNNSTGTKAGRIEPSATATSRSDSSDDDRLMDSLMIIVGSVAGALCFLMAIALCVIRRRRQNRQVGSTFVMSSHLPPTKKYNWSSSSVDPAVFAMGGQIKVFYPESPAQPLVHNHESYSNSNNSASHLYAQGDQGSPLNVSSPVPPPAAATVAIAAPTTIINSYTCMPPTMPTIFRLPLSQVDLCSTTLSSNPTSLNTPNTPSSSTISTPDQLYFEEFRHLQHGLSRAKKRQTGSQLTSDNVLSSSPILPCLALFPVPVAPASVSVSSPPQPQPPTLSYTPSTASMRSPHTVVSDDPDVQLAFKKIFALQTTTTSIITPSNANDHGAPSSSSYSPTFSNNR